MPETRAFEVCIGERHRALALRDGPPAVFLASRAKSQLSLAELPAGAAVSTAANWFADNNVSGHMPLGNPFIAVVQSAELR
jgi:hypothetical protein